jgi:hypothetical protein
VSCVLTCDKAICDRIWSLPVEAKWQLVSHLHIEDEGLRLLCSDVGASYDEVLAVPKHSLADDDDSQPIMLTYPLRD